MKITKLFQLFLEKGYHPLVFKNATIYAFPKLRKQPQELLRSYWLIALLCSLGKVVQKTVAKWLGQMALKHYIVNRFHFGAIASQSVVNAAKTRTHNVKKTFNKKYIFTALAFDIKGAFDMVTEKCFI